MTTENKYKIGFFVLLFIVLTGTMWTCCRTYFRNSPEVSIQTIRKDSLIYDSIPYEKTIVKPVWITTVVDTQAILAGYSVLSEMDKSGIYWKYMCWFDYDTIVRDDTSAFIQLRAQTFQNELQILDVDFINRRPSRTFTTIQIKTLEGCRTQFAIGGGTSYNWGKLTGGVSLHASIGYISKKHFGITASVDPFTKSGWLTGYYLVGKK